MTITKKKTKMEKVIKDAIDLLKQNPIKITWDDVANKQEVSEWFQKHGITQKRETTNE